MENETGAETVSRKSSQKAIMEKSKRNFILYKNNIHGVH
jgi:hypothetical protein